MTIRAECLSLIIPIWKVVKIFGLSRTFAMLHLEGREPVLVHDEQLLRFGAMNQLSMETMLTFWQDAGLRLTKKTGGVKQWADVCVVDEFSGPTLPCSWLAYDAEQQMVEWADRSDKREELGGANEDRSRSMAFKESGISLDFNSVIRFMSETTSQVTWKLRGSVEEIARKVEGLPQMKAKYEVLCLATPPDVSCQTVHSLASLFERFTGQEGSLSIAVRFEAREASRLLSPSSFDRATQASRQ